MRKIFWGLVLLFLTGCYQTLKSSHPYQACLNYQSGSLPFVQVQECAQQAINKWQRQDPNLRVERNPYLDAYVNDLVDQVRRGQISDPKARLMFTEKVIEIERNANKDSPKGGGGLEEDLGVEELYTQT